MCSETPTAPRYISPESAEDARTKSGSFTCIKKGSKLMSHTRRRQARATRRRSPCMLCASESILDSSIATALHCTQLVGCLWPEAVNSRQDPYQNQHHSSRPQPKQNLKHSTCDFITGYALKRDVLQTGAVLTANSDPLPAIASRVSSIFPLNTSCWSMLLT